MTYIQTVTSKGQTTIPKPIRDALGIKTGDKVVFRLTETSKKEKNITIETIDSDKIIEELAGSLYSPNIKYVPIEKVRKIAYKKLGEEYARKLKNLK